MNRLTYYLDSNIHPKPKFYGTHEWEKKYMYPDGDHELLLGVQPFSNLFHFGNYTNYISYDFMIFMTSRSL